MPLLTTSNNSPTSVVEALPMPIGTDVDESQWRSLSKASKQDLPPLDQTMQARISRFNYTRNLVGHRLLELMRDYVIGGDVGIRIMAKEPKVQDIIDAHWLDPANDWPRRLPQDVLDLSQDGELIIPAEVSQGRVFFGKIDPTVVKEVEADAFYSGRIKSITLMAGDSSSNDPKMSVIALDRDDKSETFRRRMGDVFFWTINKPSGGTRGVSDLISLNDVLDQVDRFIYARSRNAELRNDYIWDVTMRGATDSQIRQFLEQLRADPPAPGSVRAHNEFTEWQSVRPNTQADDARGEAEMLLSYVLFGFGVPPTVTGVVSTGRTALSEQIDMLYKTFSSRAREIRNIVADIINFVIDQAIIHELLSPDIDASYRIVLPRIALRDIQRTGGALSRVGEFFRTMRDLKVYNNEDIREMMDIFLAALGFDVPDGRRIGTDREEEEKPPRKVQKEPKGEEEKARQRVRVAAGKRR